MRGPSFDGQLERAAWTKFESQREKAADLETFVAQTLTLTLTLL